MQGRQSFIEWVCKYGELASWSQRKIYDLSPQRTDLLLILNPAPAPTSAGLTVDHLFWESMLAGILCSSKSVLPAVARSRLSVAFGPAQN